MPVELIPISRPIKIRQQNRTINFNCTNWLKTIPTMSHSLIHPNRSFIRENKNTKIQDGVAKGRKQSTDIPRA